MPEFETQDVALNRNIEELEQLQNSLTQGEKTFRENYNADLSWDEKNDQCYNIIDFIAQAVTNLSFNIHEAATQENINFALLNLKTFL